MPQRNDQFGEPGPSGANRRRSERVMLQIPITVLTENAEGDQLREDTHTMVVNAHGGLMKMETEVVPGQPLVLINASTNKEESCRVVRVDHAPGGITAVSFEFDWPAPDFWPVVFPPPDWHQVKV